MLYELNKPEDLPQIKKYGKAYGTALLREWLPGICKTNNLFIVDSEAEFKKVQDRLPEIFICRADAKTGEAPTLGVEGCVIKKEDAISYIKKVKQSNPNGVTLLIDTQEGTKEKVNTNGAFNVYLQMDDKLYIDFLGKGFDMGAITKGKENHESWVIDWKDILFVTPENMNTHRKAIISEEHYLESARRRLQYLIDIGYKKDEIKGKIPKKYQPMSLAIKEMILEQIVMPLYLQKEKLSRAGLKSFGVQGMVLGDELFPIECNRMQRFADKSVFEK